MFGIGMMEMAVIAVAILVFVGPQKMPQMMRQAGRFFVQMRRTATDVRSTFDGVIRDAEAEIKAEEFAKMKETFAEAKDAMQAPLEVQEFNPHADPHHTDSDHVAPDRADPHHQSNPPTENLGKDTKPTTQPEERSHDPHDHDAAFGDKKDSSQKD